MRRNCWVTKPASHPRVAALRVHGHRHPNLERASQVVEHSTAPPLLNQFWSSPSNLWKRRLPMLPVASIPVCPPELVTTVSISFPLSTTTKFVTTVGLPSVKLMVKVPVQLGFTE